MQWRDQAFQGLHEPLIDDVTFACTQRLLAERGEDFAARRANTSGFLPSRLIRCGRCRRGT